MDPNKAKYQSVNVDISPVLVNQLIVLDSGWGWWGDGGGVGGRGGGSGSEGREEDRVLRWGRPRKQEAGQKILLWTS